MTTSFERLASGSAALTDDAAHAVVRDAFGIDAVRTESLPGESDCNALVVAADGSRFVLKVAAAHVGAEELALQNAALAHLASADVGVAFPAPVVSRDGRDLVEVSLESGTHLARMLTWVPGRPIRELSFRGQDLLHELGVTAGRIVVALSGFDHPGADRTHHWDVRRIPDAIAECVPSIEDASQRAVASRFAELIEVDALAALPVGFVHQDLNDHNVLVAQDGGRAEHISGVLDMGDALRTIRVGELAVAAAYAMRDADDPLDALACVTRGFNDACPLTEDEANAVFPLTAGRLAVNVTTWTRRLALEPDNTYAIDRMRGSWDVLHELARIDPLYATAVVRAECGFEPHPRSAQVVASLVDLRPVVELADAPGIDLSPDADVFDTLEPSDLTAVRAAVGDGVAPYGGVDLTLAKQGESDTIRLGPHAFAQEGTTVRAPLDATVDRVDGATLVLGHDAFWTVYAGLTGDAVPGDKVRTGDAIGTVGPDGLVVQIACSIGDEIPAHTTPSRRAAALSTFPDASVLFGRTPATPTMSRIDDVTAIRTRRFAPSQRSYYRRPMNLVRARGVWFSDEDGSMYLDAVNNVTHVGHGHPRVVEAVHRQMHRLNTNSRFVYSLLADYAERLASHLPAPLEVVFLVCTGSEANDLALRIARTVTEREPVVVIDGAYHGNTAAVTAVSPNRYKSIGADAPPTTIEVPQPNRYRGPYGYDVPDAGAKYAAAARERIASFAGGPPAAVIAEPLMGTAGQIVHPDGYIGGLFDAARAAGGLAICDEVQVGFGRMGSTFWGFQLHDVVPDIVTMGKPIGNGFPLAAVATTREIAEAFDNGMRYFNTFGGNPVACAAGMAVLDVIEDEGLQAHALHTGTHLRDRLVDLETKHELIGDVRGVGMYVGVELVRDRMTKEPAREEAYHVSERLKDLGVITYPNGSTDNILKLKPPMVFTDDHADIFVNSLDEVLTRGW